MKRNIPSITISLDGYKKETVESFKTNTNFERVVRNMKLLKKLSQNKFELYVVFVATKDNISELVKYVEFFGLASHAAGAPQDGINALKAANIAMLAMDSQRESFEDKDKVRVHGILTAGGTSVNSIPSIAKLEWRIRGRTIDVVNKINIKLDRSI